MYPASPPDATSHDSAAAGAPPTALAWILLIVFLDMMGVGLLVPVIPFLVEQFRDDALTIGWLSLAYAAAQLVSAPLLGAVSDRYGRRPILLVSLLGSALAYFAFGAASALWMLFLGRIIDGLTGANVGTSQAYIADITPAADRSRAMGLTGAALGLGFIVGPGLGVGLSQVSVQTPAYAAAGLAFASTVLAWWYLPESLPVSRRTRSPVTGILNPLAPLRLALARPALRSLVVAAFLANFAMAGLQSNFALFATVRLGYGPRDVNLVFAFLGVMMVIAQGGLVRRAVGRWGDRGTLGAGMALSTLGFLGLSVAHNSPALYAMVAVTAVGVGLGTPTMAALISHRSADEEQGAMLGAAQAASALARVIGPVWAGFVFDAAGAGYPYSSGACLVAAALAVVLLTDRPEK